MSQFLVIDTEGKEYIREIAIINHQGELIYEAFTQEHPSNTEIRLNIKPLREILADFSQIVDDQLVIFHSAIHDLKVLKKSYLQAGLPWRSLQYHCTLNLSQQVYPNFLGYSLEYLSKKLNLKVNQQYFNPNQAHSARYDAVFTYQLYRHLQQQLNMSNFSTTPNPFTISRVDNPFQDHLDLTSLYRQEFDYLKSIIEEIKADPNHQSQGVVIIGEPGSGKTHLMMRLAKELLKVNRLLFIRHPNNPETILYHIYNRILESFIRKVPNTNYTQLDHLLAHSFVKLISQTNLIRLTQKDSQIQAIAKNNPLELYEKLGGEGTQTKRDYWQHIEKRASEWWMAEYGIGGYSLEIIKGIIKFCSYSRLKEKELVSKWLSAKEISDDSIDTIGLKNWDDDLDQEGFSLEAISVFSKLSLLDEPLIIVFDQLESLGLPENQSILHQFGESLKEIFTQVPNSLIILNLFPDRWQQFQSILNNAVIERIAQNQIYLAPPSPKQLRSILNLKARNVGLNLTDLFTEDEIQKILNHRSIRSVINSASHYFRYKVHQIAVPPNPPTGNNVEENLLISIVKRLDNLESNFSHLQKVIQKIEKSLLTVVNDNSVEQTIKIIESKSNITKTPSTIENFTAPLISSVDLKVKKYLEENQRLLEEDYQQLKIITDADDFGKLKTIVQAFQSILNIDIDHLKLSSRKLPEHLLIDNSSKKVVIGFLQVEGGGFTPRIKNFNELVTLYKDTHFILCRDVRMDKIKPNTVGYKNIIMLNNESNGEFFIMEKEDRIGFELIYKLIIDIQNKDFEVKLEEALNSLLTVMNQCWLIKLFL